MWRALGRPGSVLRNGTHEHPGLLDDYAGNDPGARTTSYERIAMDSVPVRQPDRGVRRCSRKDLQRGSHVLAVGLFASNPRQRVSLEFSHHDTTYDRRNDADFLYPTDHQAEAR